MKREAHNQQVEPGSLFRRVITIRAPNISKKDGIQDAANTNPGDIKEDGNQLDSDTEQTDIDGPRMKSLLVEDTPSNQQPRVDLDTHTCTHEPSASWNLKGDKYIE